LSSVIDGLVCDPLPVAPLRQNADGLKAQACPTS
jgi:hypothetical protein